MAKITKNNDVDDRTIINNNNNIITTNNNYIVKECAPEGDSTQVIDGCAIGVASLRSPQSLGGPGGSGEGVVAPGGAEFQNLLADPSLPANWDFVKIDLFDNSKSEDLVKGKTKLRVSVNIKRAGQKEWQVFRADMNSPIRNSKRGLDSDTWNNAHYTMLKDNYAELKHSYQDVRASKCYQKGYGVKGRSVEELSVIIAQDALPHHYIINLLYGDQCWVWKMRGDKGYLTTAQREKNLIATVSARPGVKVKNINAKDLLG